MLEFDRQVNLSDIVAVARDHAAVTVADQTLERIRSAHAHAAKLTAGTPTYGRSTGVGANRMVAVKQGDDEQALRLLRSHAVDAGEDVPATAVRAMLAVRLAQLSKPGSGIAPDVLPALVHMLNADALPAVRQFHSIGTGDLAALAGTALALMGERPASAPLAPMPAWGVDSALPFMSSSALTIGRAALVADELRTLIDAACSVYALSFVGLRGNPSPLSPAAASALPSPGAPGLAARLRSLVGSPEGARIQDPYALRAFTASTAPLFDTVSRFMGLVERLANTAQENPLFTETEVIHHGGFHQAALALEADQAALALAQTTPLALSRIRLMTEPDYTGRPPFLSDGTAGASGVMMVEYVAASAHGAIGQAAHPASLSTAVLSRGAEEDASFAPAAVAQLEQAVEALRVLLAAELVIAMRLLRQRGTTAANLASPALARVFATASVLPHDDADRDLRPDLEVAQELLAALVDTDARLAWH